MLPYDVKIRTILKIALGATLGPGFLGGCGLVRSHVLADAGNGMPIDYLEENFRAQRTPQDLVTAALPELSVHLRAATTCYGPNTPTGLLLSEGMVASDSFTSSLRRIAPIPAGIPSLMSDTEIYRAQLEFTEAKRAPTALEKSHEATTNTPLFTKVLTPWQPGSGELATLVRASLAKKNVTLSTLRVRRFFARSLEPSNEYQWLVVCGDIDARLPGAVAARHVWPLYAAQARGTFINTGANSSSDTMTVLQSLRDRPNVIVSNGFTYLTPEVFGASITRTPGTLRVRTRARAADALAGFRSFDALAYRESLNLHFSRYLARGDEIVPEIVNPEAAATAATTPAKVNTRLLRALANFQNVAPKSTWESIVPASSGKTGVRYLDAGCAPTQADADVSFLKGGLNAVDAKKAQAQVDSLAIGDAAVEILAPAQGEIVCKALSD